ncbi:NnrS family protein [Jannaschia formosa]|uniref:NnrS family protein n=1 Tax=Jannaschia formosa TaxID=2259592 RepID=UPI000E1BBB74|nr:NnrS family protein [Jannaschia formosa]TFL17259.1 NnrS family protein [Jannaschia formosa]
MSATSAEQMRAWRGPALLTYGFRPFFLLGAIWAALAMTLWALALAGVLALPTRLDPVSWHAHAFLFGYLGAVIAGFLLTAVPNWTGRLPVVGWRLGALVLLWATGRLAIMVSAVLPVWAAPAIDLAFPIVLGAVILREIVAGRNWKNLIVLALLGVFAIANLVFHVEAARGAFAAQGCGLRLGLSAGIGMIALIGGRIVPSFTRNWLVKRGVAALPVPPMQGFDKATLLATLAALLLWTVLPAAWASGAALLAIAVLHGLRLARWQSHRTGAEPLVWVLHAAYALVPLGALTLGLAILAPDLIGQAAAQHVWMGGAVGLMTLAVMTRATLGHTGQALSADRMTVLIYALLIGSVAARLTAGVLPAHLGYEISAVLWITAFAGFAIVYGPALALPKEEAR